MDFTPDPDTISPKKQNPIQTIEIKLLNLDVQTGSVKLWNTTQEKKINYENKVEEH